ncbi:MAG: sulfite exporter TauE/SafE family protein [Burkholderiales bacterium]|nr:sulfite exporter TauE/SafE family protein [Burkholderiales bacterium]
MWPLSPLETTWCAAALALGYAVRGAAGFGSGVIATPLLTFVLPLSTTAPMITAIGLMVSTQQAVRDWRLIDWRRIVVFIPGSIAGVALGLLIFKTVDQAALARWLGAYILAYALYRLFGERILARRITLPRWLVHPLAAMGGFVATIFGGLAGPIYVTYFDALDLSKGVFRVTVSTTLLILGVVRSIGYVATGVFRKEDAILVAAALLPVAAGVIIGERLHDKLDPKAFRKGVGVLLAASGFGLLLVR